MALLIELVVYRGMNGAELLQRLQTSKALHRPFASPKRLMRILCAIVEPTADLVSLGSNTDLVHRRRICPKPVGDDAARSPVFLHDPLEKLQRRGFVPPRGDHSLQDLALMVDGAPQIAELAVDASASDSSGTAFRLSWCVTRGSRVHTARRHEVDCAREVIVEQAGEGDRCDLIAPAP
jgi:hypothetical protein